MRDGAPGISHVERAVRETAFVSFVRRGAATKLRCASFATPRVADNARLASPIQAVLRLRHSALAAFRGEPLRGFAVRIAPPIQI